MTIQKAHCPKCRVRLTSQNGFSVGQIIPCPKCGTKFAVEKSVDEAKPKPPATKPKPAASKPANPLPLSLDDEDEPPLKKSPIIYVFLGVVVSLGVAGYFLFVKKPHDATDTTNAASPVEGNSPNIGGPPKPAPPLVGPFPRRLLFIDISKYLYLNPLTHSPAGATERTKSPAASLASAWKVSSDKDADEVFLLSDAAPTPETHLPVKAVLKGTYEKFFETSRSQDRIVVYFGGHALEVGGKAYLAPVEGDPDDPNSLIPVDEFYAKLKSCKATQKVVIWDVCRFNPQRGRLRPGSEPMSPELAKALAASPADVEVITTCQPGEHAWEFTAFPSDTPGGSTHSGSLFIEAFRSTAEKNNPTPKPIQTDAIPVAEWVTAIGQRLGEMTKLAPPSGAAMTQTVKHTGRPRANTTTFNPNEPHPKRFEMPSSPKTSSAVEIVAAFKEFGVPPIKTDDWDGNLAEVHYADDALKDYKVDVPIEQILKSKEKYKFRVAVIEALEEIRVLWKPTGAGTLRMQESFAAPVTDALKKQVRNEQNAWAFGIAKLEGLNEKLDSLVKERDKQPQRWQANFEYARATIKARLAYMSECDLMLGNILTETLPELNKKLGHDGYRLVATETAKMKSKKDVKQLATDAMELFDKLATERKGTPWAVQARRDKTFGLGLTWQAYSTKGNKPGP